MANPFFIRCRFANGLLQPQGHYACEWLKAHVEDGGIVFVEVEHGRSASSHKHQFAWIKDAWASLPERLTDAPYAATPETLRKHALIATGYHDVITVDCGTKAAAERVAPALRQAEARACGYAIAKISGPIVRVWTPESQAVRAMGNERFQASKRDILNWIAGLLDVTPESLCAA